jgi:hypothetical protein
MRRMTIQTNRFSSIRQIQTSEQNTHLNTLDTQQLQTPRGTMFRR